MTKEEQIKEDIIRRFDYLKDSVTIQRKRRIWVTVPFDKFDQTFDILVKEMGFTILLTITGTDEVVSFSVIYHLSKDNTIILNLKTNISHNDPHLKTVTSYFSQAEAYERELNDLLGIEIDGLAPGARYPLPDNWPKGDHPLRKDWKLKEVENA